MPVLREWDGSLQVRERRPREPPSVVHRTGDCAVRRIMQRLRRSLRLSIDIDVLRPDNRVHASYRSPLVRHAPGVLFVRLMSAGGDRLRRIHLRGLYLWRRRLVLRYPVYR